MDEIAHTEYRYYSRRVLFHGFVPFTVFASTGPSNPRSGSVRSCWWRLRDLELASGGGVRRIVAHMHAEILLAFTRPNRLRDTPNALAERVTFDSSVRWGTLTAMTV